MTAFDQVIAMLQAMAVQGFVVFVRVGAVMAIMPAFGERTVPMRVKLAIALAFTAIVAPAVATPAPDPAGPLLSLTIIVATEAVIGLALGIGMRLLVLALQTAGSIAAQSTSLSQILGGASVDPMPAMGQILMIGGLALAVMSGLHIRAAELMILSYGLLPAGAFPEASSLADWGTTQVARAFALAFTLAAPFVILSVLYNLTLGVINKAMPQLMVAFVGAPVITFGGLALLFLVSPLLLDVWMGAMDAFLVNPFGTPP